MEHRNIEGFENAHPGKKFPLFRTLSNEEMSDIRIRIKKLLGLPEKVDNLQLVKVLASTADIYADFDADSDSFSLQKCLKQTGILPAAHLLINFYRFDEIDELRFEDVDKYFKYMWYSGSDDIDLFDKTLSWILSVSHDGEVSVRQF